MARRPRLADVAQYVQDVGRTSRRGGMDPNDRSVDGDIARALSRMSARDFAALLEEDGAEDLTP